MIGYLDTRQWLRHDAQREAAFHTAPSRVRDLRRAPRAVIAADAVLVPLDRKSSVADRIPVTLRDVSRFGLGLVSPRLLEPDSEWRVEFLADARRLGEHLVSVRHCKRVKSAYLAGVQFCAAPDLLDGLGAGNVITAAA